MGKKSTLLSRVIGAPYILWAVLFIIVPIGMVAYYAFTDATGAFTFDNMLEIGKYTDTFLLSIWLGLLATVISLVIAYPLAYIIANSGENRQKIMMMLIMLPMWMNFLLRTYSWMTILEDNGFLTTTLNSVIEAICNGIGKEFEPIHLINTRGAVVLGMVYNFLPFMVLPIYNVLAKIDNNVINAAKDLGANPLQTFCKIILPLSVPGIISGITMVFVPALTTFVISNLLGGSKILLIGNVIEQEFTQASNWHLGSGLSMVLMIFIVISMIASAIFDKDGEGAMF